MFKTKHLHGRSIGGGLEKTVVFEWDWTKGNGGYNEHHDFFSIHWEVQVRDRTGVRLHVESPRYSVDPFLNSLKQDVIDVIFRV